MLAVSSQVVRGHVGLSAIVPALQRVGHEVLPLPTIILSNHPGHRRAAGTRIEVNTLASMLDVLEANGWLAEIDAVLTGYLPTLEHVTFVGHCIDRVRASNAAATVLVDPVLGDDPKGVYIDPAAAAAIRSQLVPRADIVTPNRFELAWLTDRAVTSVGDAVVAARTLGAIRVVATSIPDAAADRITNIAVDGHAVITCSVPRLPRVPHGTGDLLSGLIVAYLLNGADLGTSLGHAVAGVKAAVERSTGRTDLCLAVPTGDLDWASAPILAIDRARRP